MSFKRSSDLPSDQTANEKRRDTFQIVQPPVGARVSVRRPEDVKFRLPEEEIATKKLQNEARRDVSAEPKSSISMDDFEIHGLIGQGTYGKVFLAQKKKGGKCYAIKAISKQKVALDKKQHEIFRERQALILLDHPNIVKMYWSFYVRCFSFIIIGQKVSLFCA